jgi:tetratricopeptide (TPR) repeat protein
VIRVTIAISLVLAVLAAGAAHADKAKARALTERATRQYNLGEYAAAVEAFKAAYDEFPEPSLLYNIAQCERQLGHKPRAITLYKSYLRETPDAPNAADVRRLIASLEQAVAHEDELRRQTAQETKSTPTAAPFAAAPPSSATPSVPPAAAEAKPWHKRPAPWALTMGGVVAAAAGATLIGLGESAASTAQTAPTLPERYGAADDARVFRPTGYALLGVGAAALVTGVVLFAISPRRAAHAFKVAPAGGGQLALGGAW